MEHQYVQGDIPRHAAVTYTERQLGLDKTGVRMGDGVPAPPGSRPAPH